MYFPYFRGKQYELISIRDNAQRFAASGFVPIIEPVKESLSGLKRTYDSVIEAGGRSILVLNPSVGDFSNDAEPIHLFAAGLSANSRISLGVVLTELANPEDVVAICDRYAGQNIALIHSGFTRGAELAGVLGSRIRDYTHIFLADKCSRLYRKHFQSDECVLISDGFKQNKNRDYPPLELFSDLHITYELEGVNAFGDYLIVGNSYMETGGPAYAVAIHLTFIDPNQEHQMFICHFVSDRNSSPKDPAGKFSEALDKLVHRVREPGSNILHTSAVEEFLSLHKSGHFPGLGTVKKLSMNHHIETLSDYFENRSKTLP